MTFLLIGNIISFAAAIFTALASWTRNTKHVYLFQFYQCTLLAVANVFFQSWSGIATLILCALRSLLAVKGKLGWKVSITMIAALFSIGLFCNNRGGVGWIIIIATIIYTIGACVLKKEIPIKFNVGFNLVLWIIYEVIICDFSSLVMDSIVLIITFISIIRALHAPHIYKEN